ncbi:MAG: hypothetical protein ACI857_001427 [Arenicella sp.]
MNKFSELYQEYETIDLLKILEFSYEYQEEAVEAARIELASRNLSEEELRECQDEIEEFVNQKISKQSKPNQTIQTFKNIWKDVRVTAKSSVAEKMIFIVAIICLLLAFYFMLDYAWSYKMFVQTGMLKYKLFLSFTYFLQALPLFAALTIAFKQNLGWVLAYALAIHMVITSVVKVVALMSSRVEFQMLGRDGDYMFLTTKNLFLLLAFITVIVLLINGEVRKRLKVNQTLLVYSSIVSVVLFSLIQVWFMSYTF